MSAITQELLIHPGADVVGGDDLRVVVNLDKEALSGRWQSERGKNILSQWRASGFKRSVLEGLVGRYYGQIDLRGIPLDECQIVEADLSGIDFFSASFKGALLDRVNLSNTWMSETDITGAQFRWAEMEGALIDNVRFDLKTDFYGVDLSKINFTFAAVVQEQAIGQQRIHYIKQHHPKTAWLLDITCGFGRSLSRWAGWVMVVVLGFSLLYWLLPGAVSADGYLDALYFSIVTFTTLGYGDILPLTWFAKLLVIVEVGLGYVMGGLLVAILSKKVIG